MLVECFGIVIAELAPQIGKAAGKGVEIPQKPLQIFCRLRSTWCHLTIYSPLRLQPGGLALDGTGQIRKLPFKNAIAIYTPRRELVAHLFKGSREQAAKGGSDIERRRKGLRYQVGAEATTGADGPMLLCTRLGGLRSPVPRAAPRRGTISLIPSGTSPRCIFHRGVLS
ncbi:hypothetical protein PAERUG_P44_Wales_1_VIM_2_11_12_05339 [Pseudomonas aeruginosa]|nr:hypothetical protein PAERUG_P26_Wales_1_VIM_2_11_10_05010 [Pseudomonas aeruginosa]CRP60981.1 hypothetical protein PAERUG_P27_Wales_1_VIM_2_02_11_04798 [Pseudomonas aeruginosa]CRQ38641.1 hypothetical protein PAERUG_P31_Wales_1_VIM_2_11_11_05303 [Pseudomonas aeruginosa]CRR21963.1 hypothetical protein PAERUG_P44_Wales_1_VIM_2_11_12_05339 [Pseudomonas aeruginosa]CRS20019.1 hypothetical protein PAERUG_P59_Wales_1_VIM_2_09_13_05206 [Pseudomonas aeruginosa]